MRAILIGSAFALMLAGCGGAKDPNEAAKESMAKSQLKPGEYATKMTVTKLEMPGVPAAQVEQLKSQMASSMNIPNFCLTAEQAKQGSEEMFKKMGQGDCKFDKFSDTGAAVSGTMTCSGQGGMAMTMTFNGTKTDTSTATDSEVKMKGPTGDMIVGSHVEMNRVSDCKAGG